MADPYQDHPNVSPGADSVWSSVGGSTQWVANGSSSPVVGTVDPATHLPSGTEYVWMQMDGAGNLIDIISGEVA